MKKITTCALLGVLAAACGTPARADVPEGELNSLYIRPEVQLPAPALSFPTYPVVDDCTTEFGDAVTNACVTGEKERALVLQPAWDEYRDSDKITCQEEVVHTRHIQLYKNLAYCLDKRRYDAWRKDHPEGH
ncbi:hypothetical protein [Komagataeibacter sp. FNDCF1]|uniref:hypothetical protein n=1 Tax=Komagataeibacter sp. FNDCF1 TaxID=2878681 RepID=UPI001E334799|nr:hypothetical protein [Komagataeibacter sp. FNDCF1]MCE2565096.1 hypothetical protein [Komagataeibacter sp. FNDCF1]